MTSPVVIRGAELWSRWSNPSHPAPLVSGGRSWLPGGSNRLLPVLRYSIILLALCLMLSDTLRLAFSRSSSQDSHQGMQPAQSARKMHGPARARIAGAKQHSGALN